MKKLILAAFAFLPCFAVAQAPEVKFPVKLSLGYTFSPDLGHQNIKYLDNGATWLGNKTEEKVAFGFTTGPAALLQVSNRLSLESGILFANKAYRITHVYGKVGTGNEPISGDNTHQAYFIDVPAKVNYYIINRKIKAFLTSGSAANFFLNQKNKMSQKYLDGKVVKQTSWGSTGAPTINLSVLGGAGVGFDVSDNLHLRVESLYRRMLPLNSDAPFRSNLVSYGLNFGAFLTL